jgi:hypothetical protein
MMPGALGGEPCACVAVATGHGAADEGRHGGGNARTG